MNLKLSTASLISVFAIVACASRGHNESATYDNVADSKFHEVPFPNEAAITQKAVDLALANIEKARRADPAGMTRRDAHPKAHGCVKGELVVSPDRPALSKFGVFEKETKYPVWIRFSNAASIGADKGLDARGIAIKLMNVEGKKILDEEANEKTQDFLMVSDPVFPSRNIEQYVGLLQNTPLFLLTHPREAALALRAVKKPIETPLEFDYFSMSSYRLGNTMAKYKVTPCSFSGFTSMNKTEPDYLRKAMKIQLQQRDVCFTMQAQFFIDDRTTPIEDASIEWLESESAPLKIAQINIPKQEFDTEEQNKFCENLSFTPWHSLPEHRPLGNLNRARLEVYRAVSKARHTNNRAPRAEPTVQQ